MNIFLECMYMHHFFFFAWCPQTPVEGIGSPETRAADDSRSSVLVLGTELRSHAGTANVLSCCIISQALSAFPKMECKVQDKTHQ